MDFEKFYDQQGDYESFRNDPEKREEYNLIVDWKARQLANLITGDRHFNNILEVGCALGILLNNLAQRLSIEERTGLDISSENIRVAKLLYPEIGFFQGTIEEATGKTGQALKSAKFDLVLLSDIVEHIPDDLKFMRSVREISAFVLLNLPLEKSFVTRNRKYGETDPSGHLRCYDEKMALKLISEAGFEVINSFKANAFSDARYLKMYRKKRSARLKHKPVYLRVFWESYYSAEDKIKTLNKGVSERIFGTNYFALLKSNE